MYRSEKRLDLWVGELVDEESINSKRLPAWGYEEPKDRSLFAKDYHLPTIMERGNNV